MARTKRNKPGEYRQHASPILAGAHRQTGGGAHEDRRNKRGGGDGGKGRRKGRRGSQDRRAIREASGY